MASNFKKKNPLESCVVKRTAYVSVNSKGTPPPPSQSGDLTSLQILASSTLLGHIEW